MPKKTSDSSDRERLREMAFSRWDNEGGAGEGGREHHASTKIQSETPSLTNAELVQMQIRVIALENLLVVLLTETSGKQLDLAREMAAYISPRPGYTPHHLTIRAAARMVSLIDAAEHLRERSAAWHNDDGLQVDPGKAEVRS